MLLKKFESRSNQGGGPNHNFFLKHIGAGLPLGFLFICIGDGCTVGDYILMFLSILFTVFCCFCLRCCYAEYREYREYTWNSEDQQPNDINLAEVFSQESRQELTRLQHLEEERERTGQQYNDCSKLPEDQSQCHKQTIKAGI